MAGRELSRDAQLAPVARGGITVATEPWGRLEVAVATDPNRQTRINVGELLTQHAVGLEAAAAQL